MRAVRALAVSAAAVVPLALSAQAAFAAAHLGKAFDVYALRTAGTNGYRVRIGAGERRVFLAAAGHGAVAEYRVRGIAASRRLRARFPGVGRVDMRLRTGGFRRESPCVATADGEFVGRLDFSGENGYTEAHRRRVRGSITRLGGPRCPAGRPASLAAASPGCGRGLELPIPPPGVSPVRLTAIRGPVCFKVVDLDSLGRVFTAEETERREAMTIYRSTLPTRRPGTFEFNKLLTTATVIPPWPFAGSATYTGTATGRNLTTGILSGSLEVALPGLARVSLAGPAVGARLRRFPSPW